MMRAKVLFLFGLACTGVLSARTVALWPLEVTADGRFDGRCAIDSQNDLGAIDESWRVDAGTGWALPPNPDASPLRIREALNSRGVAYANSATRGVICNDVTGRRLGRDRDFTIEGWFKLDALPEQDKFGVVVTAFNQTNDSKHRWTLTLRRRPSESYACTWILWANGGTDTVFSAYESVEASEAALLGKWIHLALVHTALKGRRDGWSLYLDGEKVGETLSFPGGEESYVNGSIDLFGRRTNTDNNLLGAFDYWRISDTCLEPSQFLNAGGGPGTRIGNDTVAYWPLDVTPNGGVDGRDAVGESPLTGGIGFLGMSSFRACRAGASEACAFAGNPPNPTVTLPDGNAGSLQGAATSANIQIDGAMLNLGGDFTVEGWFAPRTSDRPKKGGSEQSVCYLFGTRPDYGKGWNLEYRACGEKNVSFVIYCKDQTDVALVDNATVSGSYDMANWYDRWHHVALTYDADGGAQGFGRWELFIDGTRTGGYDTTRAAEPVTDARPFCPGGRGNVAGRSFQGKMDCLRVCTAVLAPEQFMCTVNGTGATSVYGLWPLNVANGVDLDLRDVSGNGRHFANFDSQRARQQITPVPGEAPVITNPDSTPGFRGDRTKLHGSAGFRKLSGSNQHRSCLVTGSSLVLDALKGRENYTLECYYKRDAAATQWQECLFVVCNNANARVRIFRKADGLYVWENFGASPDLKDTQIPGTADSDLVAGVWYHIALVHTMETVDGVEKTMWRVYVDGVLKGTASQTAKVWVDTDFNALAVGGRWFSDNNSVNGNLSSVRLSRVALAPEDFLCAAPKLPAAPTGTAAYWPLDASGAGLGNLAEPGLPLDVEGTAAPQDEKAVPSIPRTSALADLVTGAARRNGGSYALGSAGALRAETVGNALSLRTPFTVEGWLKWTPGAGTADEDLVVAGDPDGHGVRIFIDKSGATPRLKVKARGLWPCTPWIDTAFDADLSPFANTWTHVAVVYDSSDYTGSWTLYADGKPLGAKIYNFYHPSYTDAFAVTHLRLGSTSAPLSGVVDMWRVTMSALTPAEFLWDTPKGATIFIR